MTGREGICSKTRTEQCAREAALAEASAALDDPEALLALRVFDTFMSQWRVGMEPVGLDYDTVIKYAKRFLRIDVDDEIFGYLQALEVDQLNAWKPAKKPEPPKKGRPKR